MFSHTLFFNIEKLFCSMIQFKAVSPCTFGLQMIWKITCWRYITELSWVTFFSLENKRFSWFDTRKTHKSISVLVHKRQSTNWQGMKNGHTAEHSQLYYNLEMYPGRILTGNNMKCWCINNYIVIDQCYAVVINPTTSKISAEKHAKILFLLAFLFLVTEPRSRSKWLCEVNKYLLLVHNRVRNDSLWANQNRLVRSIKVKQVWVWQLVNHWWLCVFNFKWNQSSE